MLSSGLKYFTEIPSVVFAMLLFFGAFFAFVIRVYFRDSSKKYYQEIAAIPLNEDHHGRK